METWGKREYEPGFSLITFPFANKYGPDWYVILPTALADAIIRDHKLAALAEEMRECLADMLNQYQQPVEVGWVKRMHDPVRDVLARYDAITTGSAEGQAAEKQS